MALLGWIANILIVVGLVTIGQRWPYAFAFTAIGEVLWAFKAAKGKQWDLFAICTVFAAIASVNLYLWTR